MLGSFAQSFPREDDSEESAVSSCMKRKRAELDHSQQFYKSDSTRDIHAKVLMLYCNVPLIVKRTIKHAVFENPIGVCSFFTLHARCTTSMTFEPRKFPLVKSRFYTVLGLNGIRYSLKGIEDGTFKQELKRYVPSAQNGARNFKDDILLINLDTYRRPEDSGEYFVCKTDQEYPCSCYKRIHGIHEDVLQNFEVCIKYYPGRTYYVYGFGRFPEKPIISSGLIDYGKYCILVSIDGHFTWIENKFISNIRFFSDFEEHELPENNTYELDFLKNGREKFEKLNLNNPKEIFSPMTTPILSNKFIAWLKDKKIPTIETITDQSSIVTRDYHGKPVSQANAISYGKRHRPLAEISTEVYPVVPQYDFSKMGKEENPAKVQLPLLASHALPSKTEEKSPLQKEQVNHGQNMLPPFQSIEDMPGQVKFETQQFNRVCYRYSDRAETKIMFTLFSSFASRQDAEKVLFICDYDVHAAYQISLYCHFNYTLVENLVQKFDHDLQTLLTFISHFAFCWIPGQETPPRGQHTDACFIAESCEGITLYRLSIMLHYLRYFTSWRVAVDFLSLFENNGFKAQSVLKKAGKPLSLPDPVEKATKFCKELKSGDRAYRFLHHFQSMAQASEFITRCDHSSDIAMSLLEKSNHDVKSVTVLLERIPSGQTLEQFAKANTEEQAVIEVLLNMKTSS